MRCANAARLECRFRRELRFDEHELVAASRYFDDATFLSRIPRYGDGHLLRIGQGGLEAHRHPPFAFGDGGYQVVAISRIGVKDDACEPRRLIPSA